MRQAAVTRADSTDSRPERLTHGRGRSNLTPRLSLPNAGIHPNVHHAHHERLRGRCWEVNAEDEAVFKMVETRLEWKRVEKTNFQV